MTPTPADPNWFRDVIEPLADSFEPAAVDEYVRIFTEAIGRPELRPRYQQIRHPRPFAGPDPAEVFVLSRVTLGADVAITSVVLDAMARRFPSARLWFVGPRKNFELFEAAPNLGHIELRYQRSGTLAARIEASDALASLLDRPHSIVVDPDSRLTQLGLIPVCPPERYYFFESRSQTAPGSLSTLTSAWLEATFGTSGSAYIAPKPSALPKAEITISLGVGENPAKRITDPFERQLLETLAATNRSILIDEGPGGEETARVRKAIEGLPNIQTFNGPFAAFAAQIAQSDLYIGYDSAGQHVAAAAGVDLITIFAGYPNPRFAERWRPTGKGRIEVVLADPLNPAPVIHQVARLIDPRP